MISTGSLSPSCNSSSHFTSTFSFSSFKTQLGLAFFPHASSPSSLPTTIFRGGFFLSPIQQTQQSILGFQGVHGRKIEGFGVSAQKRQRKGGVQLIQMDDSDDDEESLDLELDGSDDELDVDEDEDEETFVPFGKMKKWLEKKPRGFGEGKEYDISIEDKLLEEMEKSKQSEAENLRKLSEDAQKKQDQNKNKNKAIDVVATGVRVRVLNLPKKKNIHRDLSSAFKLVPGLISINPTVSGNKKTKDPICKGFAFVDFKSELDATRFVEMFSSQSVTFGKIQKQIKCEMIDSRTPNLNLEQLKDTRAAPRLTVLGLERDEKADSELDDSSLDTLEETIIDEYDGSDVEIVAEELEHAVEDSTNNHTDAQLTVSGMEGDEKYDSAWDDSELDKWEETIHDEYDGSDVEIIGPELDDALEQSTNNHSATQLTVSALTGDEKDDSDLDDSELDTWEEAILDEYDDSDVEIVGQEREDSIENLESDLHGGDRDRNGKKLRTGSESLIAHSSSLKQLLSKSKEEKLPRQKPVGKGKAERSPKKKLTVKQKAVKVPKFTVGGSSKRLKVKEKAVLSDVFSKYGAKAALASKEDS